ncbi:MAG: HIT domain-containing protein [Alphaproteobacteria bacterium]|nr:HIT domain-containing protein [Alphaproteobacteria bacterium]
MSYDTNNIFAKILRHEIPNATVYEDDFVLAFKDINPKAKIHVLVIPKGSYVDLQDLIEHGTPAEIDGFFKGILATVSTLQLANGYRLVFNTGKDSGQEVPHLHAHILAGEKLCSHQL